MWQYFPYIAWGMIGLWIFSSFLLYRKNRYVTMATSLHALATLILGVFICLLWMKLQRPPLRTLAETRIWYSFFMGAIGLVIFYMYRQKWMLSYSALMGSVFILVTYFRPDSFNKTLMPALQSIWFIPHVVVYIFAYAMLGMATVVAVKGIYDYQNQRDNSKTLLVTDRLINIGYAFLTFGLLFGALWAKEAWGHYWTWDPKETWAFISWLGYLVYIHYRYKYKNHKSITSFSIVVIAFLLLLVCWFGVNYLPTASQSVHTYSG